MVIGGGGLGGCLGFVVGIILVFATDGSADDIIKIIGTGVKIGAYATGALSLFGYIFLRVWDPRAEKDKDSKGIPLD
jgi:hypothetical protein